MISGNDQDGVWITSSDDNVVAGNLIGADVSGTVSLLQSVGVEIDSSTGNTIGGTVAGARDLISGNRGDGVELQDSQDNVVAGDWIGTDATGTRSILFDEYGNVNENDAIAGVNIIGGSDGNTIGGTVVGAADVISGNGGSGIVIQDSSDNLVEGDLIGTDVTGTKALGNALSGVKFDVQAGQSFADASAGNTIGGTVAGAADVISSNKGSGVEIDGSPGNLVEGDFIGTDASGTIALGNGQEGVNITARYAFSQIDRSYSGSNIRLCRGSMI